MKAHKSTKQVERKIQIDLMANIRRIEQFGGFKHLDYYEYTSVPNEGKRSVVLGFLMKQMGLKAGFPDLLFVWQCKGVKDYGFIEIKKPKGAIRDNQQDFADKALAAKQNHVIAYSVAEAIDALRKWGFISREYV
jgi:VRR-NUC domain